MNFKSYYSLVNEEFENLEEFLLNPDYSHLTLQQIEKIFQQKGGKILGSGAFASVYTHPSWNYALKIFSDDSCYIRYVKLAMRHYNPHFPVFLDKPRRYVPSFKRNLYNEFVYAVRMEKLFPTGLSGSEFDSFFSRIAISHPTLFDATKTIESLLPNCRLDFHSGNFMMRRDGTFVITDPVSTKWENTSASKRDERRTQVGKPSLLGDNGRNTILPGLQKLKKINSKVVDYPKLTPNDYKLLKNLEREFGEENRTTE